MFKNIISNFPTINSYNTYIEPFGGSYSVGLHCDSAPIEVYNDLERNVYSLYKVLSDPELFKEFKIKCDLSYYIEDLRKEYKTLLKQETISVLDRAFYFFYVNRTSHNGVGGLSVNAVVRRNMSKSVLDMLSCIDRLPELHHRLSKVIILNQDGIELIKKYNTENVFIYADPPYHHSTRGSTRYNIDMDDDTQMAFLEAVINSRAKILISGYENEAYLELERSGFTKSSFEISSNKKSGDESNKKFERTECLWKNY